MNTNDPAVPYGTPKEKKREPLLSEDTMFGWFGKSHLQSDGERTFLGNFTMVQGAAKAREFYEAKITSGELRVVKKAHGTKLPPHDLMWGCEHCVRQWTAFDNFCPGCGAQIV